MSLLFRCFLVCSVAFIYSADALRRGCTLSEEQERALKIVLNHMAQTVEPKTDQPESPPMDADTAEFVAAMDTAQGGQP